MTKSRNILAPRRYWTATEETLLGEWYSDLTCGDIAALLDRSPGSVYQAADRLNLAKSDEFWNSDLSGRIQRGKQNPEMTATRFKQGMVPWNKGVHYLAGGRSAETRFKKGQKSNTWQPVGSLRVVKHYSGHQHLERKTSETKGANHKRWTPVSRLVWMAVYGEVPDGHVVVFKPGMATLVEKEITVDKVECISRKELAKRNHPNSTNPELAKLFQLKGAITRQVNRIKRENEERQSV